MDPQPPSISITFTDRLPGDRTVVHLEREGALSLVFRHGEISEQAARELEALMRANAHCGSWVQNWGGRVQM